MSIVRSETDMSTKFDTEAPFVVSNNFCAVRANTVDILIARLNDFNSSDEIADAITSFRIATGNSQVRVAPVASGDPVASLAAAGITGTVIPAAAKDVAETVTDQWNNVWVYEHPDAPQLPDGRGKYALKSGTAKTGRPYKAWFDPSKGPKPCTPGATLAASIFI